MINQWIILGRYKGYRKKNKVEDEDRSDRVKGRWKDLADKVTLDQKPDWNEEAGHVESWKKNIPGKEKTKQKAPKVEVFKNQQKNPCCWNSESEERVWDEAGEVAKAGSGSVSKATVRILDSILDMMENYWKVLIRKLKWIYVYPKTPAPKATYYIHEM